MSKTQYEIYLDYLNQLAQKRAPAVARAEALLADGKYDQAEREIKAVDSSIYGGVEIDRMYQRHLQKLVAEGKGRTERALEVFRRGVTQAVRNYPDPHTEIEAEDFASGAAEDRARYVRILGYDPGTVP